VIQSIQKLATQDIRNTAAQDIWNTVQAVTMVGSVMAMVTMIEIEVAFRNPPPSPPFPSEYLLGPSLTQALDVLLRLLLFLHLDVLLCLLVFLLVHVPVLLDVVLLA